MLHQKLRDVLNKFRIAIAICAAIVLPLVYFAGASADITAPSCSSSNIQNYVQEGVNLATGGLGCDSGAGNLNNGISAIASKVVNVFSIIVGVVAVIMVIYGGFRYIISGGDSGRVGTAKNTLIYAIIGLIIVALAQLIVRYVLSTADGISTSTVNLMINTIR